MHYIICVLMISLSAICHGAQTRKFYEREALKLYNSKDFNAAKKTCLEAYEYFKNKQPKELANAAYFAYLAGDICYNGLKEYEEAEKYLSIFNEIFSSDKISSTSDISSDPFSLFGQVQLLRGKSAMGLKHYDFARHLLESSLGWNSSKETKAEACFLLAKIYENGYGVDKDKAESLYWLQKSASYGSYAAQYNLGYKYYQEKNYPVAYKFFMDSCLACENVPALTALGLMYANGEYVEKNLSKAESYYRRALDNRFGPETANNLAQLLIEENKNFSEAENLIKKAIKFKPDYSVFWGTYGLILFKKKNYHEALKMYLKANELSGNKEEYIQKQIKIIQKILSLEKTKGLAD